MKIGNLEVYGIIYKIENLVNGKVYIGQTIRSNGFKGRYVGNNTTKPIEWVYRFHMNRSKVKTYNKHLLNSIRKYGFNKFKVIEIFDIAFSEAELNVKEKCWIKIYDSTNPKNGYNISTGGDNYKISEHSMIHDGVKIICVNTNKIFKSYKAVIKYYDSINNHIAKTWITNSFKIKIKDKNKYDKPIFRIYDENIHHNKKYCKDCGKLFKPTNNSQKYCYKHRSSKNNTYKTIVSKRELPNYILEYIIENYKYNSLSKIKEQIKIKYKVLINIKQIRKILGDLYLHNKL